MLALLGMVATQTPRGQARPEIRGMWVLTRDSAMLTTRSIERSDHRPTNAAFPGDTMNIPTLLLRCAGPDRVSIAGHRRRDFTAGSFPVLYRLDGERSVSIRATHRDATTEIAMPVALDAFLAKLLAHDWLVVRFVEGGRYRDTSFDLAGLAAPLRAFAAACRVPAAPLERVTASRPAGRPRAPQPIEPRGDEHRVGDWIVNSRTDRFDDSRIVVARLVPASATPLVRMLGAPSGLYVRSMGGKLEVFVDNSPLGGGSVDIVLDDAPRRRVPVTGGGSAGAFFARPLDLLRELRPHATMVLKSGAGQATFRLAGLDSALAPVLAAARLPAGALATRAR